MIVIFSWVISLKYIIFYASGDSGILDIMRVVTELVLSIESGRVVHVLWGTTCWPLDVSC